MPRAAWALALLLLVGGAFGPALAQPAPIAPSGGPPPTMAVDEHLGASASRAIVRTDCSKPGKQAAQHSAVRRFALPIHRPSQVRTFGWSGPIVMSIRFDRNREARRVRVPAARARIRLAAFSGSAHWRAHRCEWDHPGPGD